MKIIINNSKLIFKSKKQPQWEEVDVSSLNNVGGYFVTTPAEGIAPTTNNMFKIEYNGDFSMVKAQLGYRTDKPERLPLGFVNEEGRTISTVEWSSTDIVQIVESYIPEGTKYIYICNYAESQPLSDVKIFFLR